MNPKNRFNLIAMIVVLTMFASAIWTVPARADDGAPPPPTGGDAAPTGSTTSSSTNTASLSHVPAGTDVVVVDHNGRKVALATQEAAHIAETGDPLWCPTASAPIPSAGGCTASYGNLYLLINAINTVAIPQPSANGTIWIEGGADGSLSPIVINGSSLTTWKDFSIVFKGGWTTVGSTINTSAPSILGRTLEVNNWNGDITLSDIAITGATGGVNALHVVTNKNITLTRVNSHNNGVGLKGAYLENLGGSGNVTVTSSHFDNNPGANGLLVQSNGTITLSNVTAIGNTLGTGAFLDNHTAPIAKNVMLMGDNTFNSSYYHGLQIWSAGAVTLNDVTANDNGISAGTGFGVDIDNTYAAASAVTLTGTSILTENYQGGLYISSNGAIKANNVIANSNTYGSGAYLYNGSATTAQPITLTGTNQFKYNYTSGLDVFSNGSISVNNITASYNRQDKGASLINSSGSYTSGITLTGTNTFNENHNTGLNVSSYGAVNLHSVTANDNGLAALSGYGLYISNSGTSVKPVTLSGTNTFNHNYQQGLYIESEGTISLTNITANDSVNSYGGYLYNDYPLVTSPIVISGINNFNNNYYSGLDAVSFGAITTNNITANGNGNGGGFGNGVYLDNCINFGPGCSNTSTQPVTMNGTNVSNNNYDTGIVITSKGTIKINSLTANNNAIPNFFGWGLWLDNCVWDGVSACSGNGSIVTTGISTLNGNYTGGGYIYTRGTVSMSNITASNTILGYGLSIYNKDSGPSLPKNVTLTGTNVFNNNWHEGLGISTYGTITLNNITANDNGQSVSYGWGASLNNSSGTISRDVILTGTNTFNANYSNGLIINSLGNIKISNLHASSSVTGNGAYISNQFGSGTPGITLSGTNVLSSNEYDGLSLLTWGAISINNLTASENGQSGTSGLGASIDNTGGPLIKNVTLTGTNTFDHNYNSGLGIVSLGSIKANNLSASNNVHGLGANLSNAYGLLTSTASISLTGISNFNSNAYSGLYLTSYGVISVSTTSLSAVKNGLVYFSGYGVYFNNSGSTAVIPPGVSLKGNNTLDGNYSGGLYIDTNGAVSLNSIHASSNTGGTGAQVANHTLGKAVTLTGINVFNSNSIGGLSIASLGLVTLSSVTANDNSSMGLSINTQGAITLKNITASGNLGGEGANLNNSAGSPQAVTLSGTNVFNDNFDDGLYIDSLGAISTSNVTANGNGQSGIDVDNHFGTAGVTMTGVNTANGNSVVGFHIHTTGAVTLTSLTADGNTGTGLAVDAAAANVKLTCGSFTNNGGNGVNVSTSGTLTLIGVVASGNVVPNIFFAGTPIIVRTCPLTP